jgi:hypothetical protein
MYCHGRLVVREYIDSEGVAVRTDSIVTTFVFPNDLNVTTIIQVFNATTTLIQPGNVLTVVSPGQLKYSMEAVNFPYTTGQFTLTRLAIALYVENAFLSWNSYPYVYIPGTRFRTYHGDIFAGNMNISLSLQEWCVKDGVLEEIEARSPVNTGIFFYNEGPPQRGGGYAYIFWPKATKVEWDPTFDILFSLNDPLGPPQEAGPSSDIPLIAGVVVGVVVFVVILAAVVVVISPKLRRKLLPFLDRKDSQPSFARESKPEQKERFENTQAIRWTVGQTGEVTNTKCTQSL